ncbi:ABC transporter substrate-binding protein [Paenibacillus taiwanensis]|uniref:ABC transporter substrate-binding protein n=1 Tax=Paenibacillus taiwanensis TaxID=401638 RepID=UPI00040778A6|nr:ABC transporter substrate-binding protein [Paenibacillus taiwanensis]
MTHARLLRGYGWISFFILVLLLTGCRTEKISTLPVENVSASDVQPPQELTVWCYGDSCADFASKFEQENKGVKINVKRFTYNDHAQTYLDAMVKGKAPDVMEVENTFLGEFNAIEGIVNLLEEPFRADLLKATVAPALWDATLSYDGTRLIALPVASSPRVTFYRKDILEKYGFPSEPEALGRYMEDPERWLNMAIKLRKEGIFITQWDADPMELYETTVPQFDSSMRFNRNNEVIRQGLELSQEVNRRGLDANIGLWTELGEQALQSGKLAMVYLGTWGELQLEQWAPKTTGLWRVTRLPFNLYGYSGSTSLMLSEQSKNKPLAWKFMYSMFMGMDGNATVAAHLPSRKTVLDRKYSSNFLGGQYSNELYMDLAMKMREYKPTPLDVVANEWFRVAKLKAIEFNMYPATALKTINDEINVKLEESRRILLARLNKRR